MVSTGVTVGIISTSILFLGFIIATYMHYNSYEDKIANKDNKLTQAQVDKAKEDKKTAGWAAVIMFFLVTVIGIGTGVMHNKQNATGAVASAVKFYYF